MNTGKKRDSIILKVLGLLLKRGPVLSTQEILSSLKSEGTLGEREGDKKVLLRALTRMEEIGIISSKGGRGRKGKEWQLTEEAERTFSQISERESLAFLTLLSLLPDEYKRIPLFKLVERIALKVSKRMGNTEVNQLKQSFFYQKPYTMRFCPIKEKNFELIVDVVVRRKPVEVIRKELPTDKRYEKSPPEGTNIRELYPISLFYYDGNFYLGTIRKHGEEWRYRSYFLASLKVFRVKEEEFPNSTEFQKLEKEKKRVGMDFPEPRPFLFKVILSKLGGRELKIKGALAFSTQVGEPKVLKDGSFEVVVVGFVEPRFCSEFLIKDFIALKPLSEKEFKEKLKEAREAFKERELPLPLPPKSYKKNQENFKAFKKEIEQLLNKKLKAI